MHTEYATPYTQLGQLVNRSKVLNNPESDAGFVETCHDQLVRVHSVPPLDDGTHRCSVRSAKAWHNREFPLGFARSGFVRRGFPYDASTG